jgi:protein phosphatase
VGCHHDRNEDAVFPQDGWPAPFDVAPVLAAERGYLLAVADGVSSAGLGAAASERAVRALVQSFYHGALDGESVQARLAAAMAAANDAAWALTATAGAEEMAATTLVAAAIRDGVAWVANTGDSRAYLVTPGEVIPLTADHSVVQELLDAGAITAAEAFNHPDQGVLTRALGIASEVSMDVSGPRALGVEDALLLCSDGLTTAVVESELGRLVRNKPPQGAVRSLIALANRAGGYDNVSVVIACRPRQRPWWRRWLG